MKKLFVFIGLSAFAATGQVQAAPTNLLTNGSFEVGSDGLTGWTVNNAGISGTANANVTVITYGSTGNTFGEAIPADGGGGTSKNPGLDPVGTHGVYFVADDAQQSLSQTVTVQAGKSYTVGFDVYKTYQGDGNAGNAALSASLAGTQFVAINTASTVLAAGQWTTFSGAATFNTATTGTFTINFTTPGGYAKDFVVDRVFLTETSAVPEPATLGIMAMGVGFLGVGRRRRMFSNAGALTGVCRQALQLAE